MKIFLATLVFALYMSVFSVSAHAQEQELDAPDASAAASASATTMVMDQESFERVVFPYDRGVVLEVLEEVAFEYDGKTTYAQRLQVRNMRTQEVSELTVGSEFQPLLPEQRFSGGSGIILTSQSDYEGNEYVVLVDFFRLPILLFLGVIFLVVVGLVGGSRGMLSVGGMLATFFILGWYLLPALLSGANPVVVSTIAAVVAGAVTVYLSHGFHKKSHIAFGSIVLILVVVVLLARFAVVAARLFGLGDEQAYFLQFADYGSINLQGLFLAGIIIGALGVLDDIIVAQVSVVEQLLGANAKLSKQELYFRALEVGKDHVASLVNTLVLAYAGASLPLFLLVFADTGMPLWVKLNDQVIAEEIVRTLSGSIGLVLAVPLTTLLAAYALKPSDVQDNAHHGGHRH